MGQDRSTCIPYLSSYSSLQGADRYLGKSVIMDLTEESKKGVFPSHSRHTFMLSQDACHRIEGRSKYEGKVAVSRSASLPGGVNHAGRGFFWSEKAEKKGQPLTLWVLLLTGSIPLVFFFSPCAGYFL
jgi:hypothetical protein